MRKGPRREGEPKLLGAKEVAAVVGTQQTNIRTLAGLPEPYDTIAATTLWRETEVEAFARARNKRRATEAERRAGKHAATAVTS